MTSMLSGMSTAELVDSLGLISTNAAELEAKRKAVIAELLARDAGKKPDGRFFCAVRIDAHTQTRLDRSKLAVDLGGEDALAPYLNWSTVSATYKVEAKKSVAAAALVAAK